MRTLNEVGIPAPNDEKADPTIPVVDSIQRLIPEPGTISLPSQWFTADFRDTLTLDEWRARHGKKYGQ